MDNLHTSHLHFLAGRILPQFLMDSFHSSGNDWILSKTGQLLVVLEEPLLTLAGAYKIHCSDTILSDTQPLFRLGAVLVGLNGILKCQLLAVLLLWGIDFSDDKPLILMWDAWFGSGLKLALALLCQSIVTGAARIALTAKIQQNIIHRLFDLRIIRQCFKPEASDISIRQFLPNHLQILPRTGEFFLISVGEGCLANDPPMLGQFLLVQIVAVQVPAGFTPV